VDMVTLQDKVAAVEVAARDATVKHARVVHELDRLAEQLIGESAPEVQHMKQKIQRLITQVAPERRDVLRYVEVYCPGH